MSVIRLAASCLVLIATAPPAAAVEHDYRVRVDAALSQLQVEARIGAGTAALVAGGDAAVEALRGVDACGDMAAPRRDGRRIVLGDGDGDGVGNCVRYVVSLDDMPRGWWQKNLDQADDNCTVAIASWLWLPEAPHAGSVRVRFELPDGFGVSVPWQAVGKDSYVIPASPGSGTPVAVFGRFERISVAVPGGALDVAVLRGSNGPDTAKVNAWLASAANNVALVYGRFPNPGAQVIVNAQREPAGYGTASAVPFGHVIRDGGESVQFYINNEKPPASFLGDWTATHEFAHLL
ncbi:MAG: hypothetical protein KJO38_12480, partial [Gammaproteobacteria bacterium]|nr:hypothetical protein [Gammaproteobacteria bacterium]